MTVARNVSTRYLALPVEIAIASVLPAGRAVMRFRAAGTLLAVVRDRTARSLYTAAALEWLGRRGGTSPAGAAQEMRSTCEG